MKSTAAKGEVKCIGVMAYGLCTHIPGQFCVSFESGPHLCLEATVREDFRHQTLFTGLGGCELLIK